MSDTYKECKFYMRDGKCRHKDAPTPGHMWCIGKERCGVWGDDIANAVPIVCPDCDTLLTEVTIERFMTKTFLVNHETRQLTPKDDSDWEPNDLAIHCGECDTLNVDQDLREYEILEVS